MECLQRAANCGAVHENLERLLLSGYLVCVGALFNCIGFTLVTMFSRAWRQQRLWKVAALGGSSGAASFLITCTGLTYSLFGLIPQLKLFPRIAITLVTMLPGLLCGVLAVMLAWAGGRTVATKSSVDGAN